MNTNASAIGLTIAFLSALAALSGCSSDERSLDEPESIGVVKQAESEWCGNGITETGELCDNGDYNSDVEPNACRTDCRTAYCGDNVVDFGESCDQEVYDPSWCNNSHFAPTCIPNTCGSGEQNKVVTAYGTSEACDDHNSEDGDTCRSDCGQDLSKCGNNVVDQGEQCDLGPVLNSELPNKQCRKSCQVARCGDGIVDNLATPPEQCDRSDGCGPDCKML